MGRWYETAQGMVVAVEFLDHCDGGKEPLLCRAYGTVVEVRPRHLVVCYWKVLDEDQETHETTTRPTSSCGARSPRSRGSWRRNDALLALHP